MPQRWTFSTDLWVGCKGPACSLGTAPWCRGRTASLLCVELGLQPHLFPRLWLAPGCRALEGPHRTATQARPLDASRAVGTCGHLPTPAIPSAALLRTSRGPLKPKPPDLPGARPGKGLGCWPLSFPETTTQLCESPSTLCRRPGPRTARPALAATLEACVQAVYIYTYTYTCIHSPAVPAARPRGDTASYLNVLLGTHSMTHRAS